MAIKYFIVKDKELKHPLNITFIIKAEMLDKQPVLFFDIDIIKAIGWTDTGIYSVQFLASAHIQWDACCHWYFHGEDYLAGDMDSYYHLCGDGCFLEFIYGMIAGVKVGKMINKDKFYFDDFKSDPYMKFEKLFDEEYTIEEIDEDGLIDIGYDEQEVRV